MHIESPVFLGDPSSPSVAESTVSEQREIGRCHRNWGHLRRYECARAWAHARCKPHLVRWARDKSSHVQLACSARDFEQDDQQCHRDIIVLFFFFSLGYTRSRQDKHARNTARWEGCTRGGACKNHEQEHDRRAREVSSKRSLSYPASRCEELFAEERRQTAQAAQSVGCKTTVQGEGQTTSGTVG